jgi:MFS transporter, DHA1 family, multidrug resistance protein
MLDKARTRLRGLPAWQRTLWIMFFAQVCTATGFSIIFPFLPLYVESLGTTTSISIEFWAGMVFSAQAFTMMFASPIWGALADRYGRKMMVQRAVFGGTIVIFLMAFAQNAEQLVLLRAVQGLVTGTVSAANALIAASAPRERVGYAMGVIQVGLWSGIAIGPLVGGVLADAFGFRVPFIITAVSLLVAGIMVHFGVHETFTPEVKAANQKKSFIGEWRHILSMRGVMPTYGVRFFAGLSSSLIIPIVPLFVVFLLSAPEIVPAIYPLEPRWAALVLTTTGISTTTGLIVGISSAAATLSGVFLGRLGDRIGHRTVLIGSSLVAMLCYIPQVFVTEPWQLILLQGMTGLAIGGVIAAPSALLARYTDPGEEGAVYGLDNSVVSGARGIAPLIGAAIAVAFGLRAVFAAMGLLFVVIIVVVLVLLPRDQVKAAAPVEPIPEPETQPRQVLSRAGD